jgi:uncharacterized membrane protein YdjX (TVP38/TMEM64 family)
MSDSQAPRTRGWLRYLPVAAIVAAVVAIFATGAHRWLSLEALRDNRADLIAFVAEQPAVALSAYLALYVIGTMLAIPGLLWVTIAGGFLFGTWGGFGLTWFAATLGATALFLAARGAFADLLAKQAKGWLAKLRQGFNDNAFNYLLSLRLMPFAPFPVVNIAPALLGVKTRDYVAATALGIIPGVFVYTSVGAGLGAVLDAGGTPNLSLAARPEVWGPLVGLGLLSLLPIAWKAWRKGRPA